MLCCERAVRVFGLAKELWHRMVCKVSIQSNLDCA